MPFEEEKGMEGLAQRLQQDTSGQVMALYENAFETLMTQAQCRLREPLAKDEYLLNKTIAVMAENAQRVVKCYWEQCHQRHSMGL